MNQGLADQDWLGGGSADGEITPSAALFVHSRNAEPTGGFRPPETANSSEPPECSSEELAQRYQAGCPDSFEQLVLRYETRVFNFFRQFTGNHHDAEDLTQETFVKAHRSLHRYNPSFRFSAWLFTIARRTGANHFRALKRFEELPVDEETLQETPATVLEGKDAQESLWRLVRTLKPKQAQALWLRHGEGFSVAETARIMRTNAIHVKVMLHRARSQLFRLLTTRDAGMASRTGLNERAFGKRPDSSATEPVS